MTSLRIKCHIIIFFVLFIGFWKSDASFSQQVFPGLYENDGTPHDLHKPHPVTGQTLNVIDFGADPRDNEVDDRPAVEDALQIASFGDELYFPAGVYNFSSTKPGDYETHFQLKSGVNWRGDSPATTILKSEFDDKTIKRFFKIKGLHDLVIANFTITSNFQGDYSRNTSRNNSDAAGPKYVVSIDNSGFTPSFNITIDSLIIENYRTHGVRLSNSHDVIVKNSTFRNATDVGGGGAGYGVSIQGDKQPDNNSKFNVVEHCRFIGPYIRHGIILQYATHNNAVRFNYCENHRLDAIDLHGEDEYLNEIYENEMRDITTGAGVGVGNTGATHDASGPHNYIHDNRMINCREGVKVYLGSPDTRIEYNTVTNSTVSNGKGILVLNGPRTLVKGNYIYDNPGINFTGIYLQYDGGTAGTGQGPPRDVQILENEITHNDYGVVMYAGKGIIYEDNQVYENRRQDFYASSNVIFHKLLDVKIVGRGHVDLDPPGGSYQPETAVTVTAKRAANWAFSHWEGDIQGTENPVQVVIDGNKDITAVFTEKPNSDEVSLAVHINGQGRVQLNPPGGIYNRDDTVAVSAQPDSGWVFDRWSGDLTGSAIRDTMILEESKSITAEFIPVPRYTVIPWIVGSGRIEFDPAAESYPEGTHVLIYAIPDDGWRFVEWGGDLSGSQNPDTLIIDGEKAVMATFEQETRVSSSQKVRHALYQNYPNPFNGHTTIIFSLAHTDHVNLRIYNPRGEQVAELVNERRSAGQHTVHWQATNVPTGVYVYRIQTKTFSKTGKMLLVR